MHWLSKKPCDITDGLHHTMITNARERELFKAQAAKDWETILVNRAMELKSGWYDSSSNPGGGVHNMLRVRVCAAHMGSFFGRNSLNKGPFWQIFHKHG